MIIGLIRSEEFKTFIKKHKKSLVIAGIVILFLCSNWLFRSIIIAGCLIIYYKSIKYNKRDIKNGILFALSILIIPFIISVIAWNNPYMLDDIQTYSFKAVDEDWSELRRISGVTIKGLYKSEERFLKEDRLCCDMETAKLLFQKATDAKKIYKIKNYISFKEEFVGSFAKDKRLLKEKYIGAKIKSDNIYPSDIKKISSNKFKVTGREQGPKGEGLFDGSLSSDLVVVFFVNKKDAKKLYKLTKSEMSPDEIKLEGKISNVIFRERGFLWSEETPVFELENIKWKRRWSIKKKAKPTKDEQFENDVN